MLREILEHVAGYLSGVISREQFEDWFLPSTWELDESKDIAASALANDIYLALAESDSGHLDDDEFRSRLSAISSQAKASRPRTPS